MEEYNDREWFLEKRTEKPSIFKGWKQVLLALAIAFCLIMLSTKETQLTLISKTILIIVIIGLFLGIVWTNKK